MGEFLAQRLHFVVGYHITLCPHEKMRTSSLLTSGGFPGS